MKKSVASLLLAPLASVASFAAAEPLLSLGWDSLTPGAQVRGLSQKAKPGSPTAEPRIYVGNAASVSAPNSLVYDFSDWPEGKSRGYPAVDLPVVTNGWTVFSLCFMRESGKAGGEIRGLYDLPGEKFNGVRRAWPILWLTFDELLSVRVEGQKRWQSVCVGSVLSHVWHRVQIAIPPVGTTDAIGRVRLERLGNAGKFEVVGSADLKFAQLVVRKVTSFDLTGQGPGKFFFDDLIVKER